jgi:hypothetical protein
MGEGWGEGLLGKKRLRLETPHPAVIASLCSALAADLSHKVLGEMFPGDGS